MMPPTLDARPPFERSWALVEAIRARRAELDSLRTMSDARAAYEAAHADQDAAIARLTRERDQLELERRRKLGAVPATRSLGTPPPVAIVREAPPPSALVTVAEPRPDRLAATDRRRLKKLVSRWAYSWQLDAEVVGRLNGIADDGDRPLGEALALLGLSAFRDPLASETPAAHTQRLAEWHDELLAYYEWLAGEIETVQLRYRGWRGVWRRWSAAREGGDRLAEWARFLEATRELKRAEIAALAAKVVALRSALYQPAARP